jgi:hypothetical protein
MTTMLHALAPAPFNAEAPAEPGLHDVATMFRWSRDPLACVREAMQAVPDKWQADVLDALRRGNTRLSVRSGNGVGKTTLLAWLAIWFPLTRYPSKCIVTAPTAQQLYDNLWSEVRRWLNNCPPWIRNLFNITNDRLELTASPAECFVSARTSRAEQPEAIQGIHSANVLLIVDEASGVPEPVFEAGSGSMSTPGAITILAGNPLRNSGFFYRTHTDLAGKWLSFRVSCLECPRVTRDWIAEQADSFGIRSARYQARVLGEFPQQEDDVLIPRGLVLPATDRPIPMLTREDYAGAAWGLDVARFGMDSSVLVKRIGPHMPEPPRIWKHAELMHIVGAVRNEYFDIPGDMRPAVVCVDAIGMGAGVAERLQELEVPVMAVSVSESPSVGGQYYRLRDELYGRLRDWFETRQVTIPLHDRMISEITTVRYRFMSDGRMRIETKDEMRKRDLPSPDCADALALTFAIGGDTPLAWASAHSGRHRRRADAVDHWVV